MKAFISLSLVLILVSPLRAQVGSSGVETKEPVVKWADYTSYATAALNPSVALIKALRGENKGCHVLQLVISEAIGNGSTLLIKHLVTAERPCLGCAPDGMPSGHSMNGWIGARQVGWKFSVSFGIATPILRPLANRHTVAQVVVGSLIGIGSDLLGNLLHCDSTGEDNESA